MDLPPHRFMLSEDNGRQLVYFAAERTLLAWISASLGLMALGFVVDRFSIVLRHILTGMPPVSGSHALSGASGTTLVLLGGLMSLTAAIRYAKFSADYRSTGAPRPGYGVLIGVGFALVVAALAAVLAVVLLTVTD
jgi:inner membrane protein YidH